MGELRGNLIFMFIHIKYSALNKVQLHPITNKVIKHFLVSFIKEKRPCVLELAGKLGSFVGLKG